MKSPLSDTAALNTITALLSRTQRDANTIDTVANIIRATGRSIGEFSPTKTYRVSWEIDIDAHSPKKAANIAFEEYYGDSTAAETWFRVFEPNGLYHDFEMRQRKE